MIDDRHAELFFSPRQRVWITAFPGQKQRAKFLEVILAQVFSSIVLAFDRPKSGGGREKYTYVVLRDYAPECTRIRGADRFAFVKNGGVAVQQWSINDVRVTPLGVKQLTLIQRGDTARNLTPKGVTLTISAIS